MAPTGRGGISIVWEGNSIVNILHRMKLFGNAIRNAPTKSFEYWAPIIQQHARDQAKWADRTGAARKGLIAGVEDHGGGEVELYLMHTVSYGVWLEIRWQGKFATVGPTLIYYHDQIMSDLGRQVFLQLPG